MDTIKSAVNSATESVKEMGASASKEQNSAFATVVHDVSVTDVATFCRGSRQGQHQCVLRHFMSPERHAY